MKMKKLLALLLTLVMLVGLLPTMALAEGEESYATNIVYDSAIKQNGNYEPPFVFSSNVKIYSFQTEFNQDSLTFSVSDNLPVGTYSEVVTTNSETNVEVTTIKTALKTSTTTKTSFTYYNFTDNSNTSLGITPGSRFKVEWKIGKKDTDTNGDNKINNKDNFTEVYETYTLNIERVPIIGWLQVFDAQGSELILTPTSAGQNDILPFVRNYTTSTNGNTIKITAHGGNANMAGTNNYAEVWFKNQYTGDPVHNLKQYEIDLSNYDYFLENDATVAVIPLQAKYGNAVTEYQLFVSTAGVPIVSVTPTSAAPDKGASVTLTANVSFRKESDRGTLSYQWLRRGTEIEGATEATYTVPTDRAWEQKYSCRVTNTLNGEQFVVISDETTVITNLTSLNAPLIRKDLSGTADVDSGDYRTDYTAGEKLNALFIQTDYPEDGALYGFQMYYNTEQSAENATPFGGKVTPTGSGVFYTDNNYENWRINPDGLPAGEWYIFAKAISTPRYDDTLELASTRTRFIKVNITAPNLSLKGSGTSEDPYLIGSIDDMTTVRELVNAGDRLDGIHFLMTADIELPVDWTPIGYKADESSAAEPFSGILDGGGFTVKVAEGGKPLFSRVSDAEIKNLSIYGKQIDGCGLINESFLDYGPDGNYNTGVPDSVTLDHVRLLSGSATKRAGLMEGSGSGANTITIINCVVEDGVTIGYSKDQSGIGSFVGSAFNGRIYNSYSYADVYGTSCIGGFAGSKGQAMGACDFYNSAFMGTVTATGTSVGGLIGEGYVSESAPNTQVISFDNCYVAATITGADKVGGLIGAESGIVYAINNHTLADSFFYGTLTATAEGASSVGGIVGYYNGLNAIGTKQNNYFYETSGTVTNGIGSYGGYNRSTVEGGDKYDFADAAAFQSFLSDFGKPMTAEAFADGTVLTAMLAGGADNAVWKQGTAYPEFTGASSVIKLALVGEPQTTYYIGDAIGFSNVTLTATYSDGKIVSGITIDGNDQVTVTGYDNTKQNIGTVTLTYGTASTSFKVTVLKPNTGTASDKITVYFKLLGDHVHDSDTDGEVHTLQYGGLETWLPNRAYTISQNSTVWDLVQIATAGAGITCGNPSGNYVEDMTYNGVPIGEFTNGNKSGWMYTLNGHHPLLGVMEQFLEDGDRIVWHYTDDYTIEEGSEKWEQPAGAGKKNEKTYQITVAATENGTATASAATASEGERITVTAKPAEGYELDSITVKGEKAGSVEVKDGAFTMPADDVTVTVKFKKAEGKKTTAERPFTDVKEGDWFYDAVYYCFDKGYFKGTSETGFEPQSTMTRAMFATVLWRIAGQPAAKGGKSFSDVEAGQWYTDAVAWASGEGILDGYGGGAFGTNDPVTREQIATLLYRFAKAQGVDVSGAADLAGFPDGGSTSPWASDAMAWAVSVGLFKGDDNGALNPGGKATRAEVATLVQRLAGLLVK